MQVLTHSLPIPCLAEKFLCHLVISISILYTLCGYILNEDCMADFAELYALGQQLS